jgi:hypothetical protein
MPRHYQGDRRRLLCNARDPEFQGDGWRWTLSFWLPEREIDPANWPILRRLFDGSHFDRAAGRVPFLNRLLDFWSIGPERICNLPLTSAQREACWREWEATQQHYAQLELGRELSRFELDRLAATQ